MAEVKSSLLRTSAKELKPATWMVMNTTIIIIMISVVLMVTSLVHLMMIGQKGCKEGRERCRSSLVIILYHDNNDDHYRDHHSMTYDNNDHCDHHYYDHGGHES